jgi:hypothetical protein
MSLLLVIALLIGCDADAPSDASEVAHADTELETAETAIEEDEPAFCADEGAWCLGRGEYIPCCNTRQQCFSAGCFYSDPDAN